MRVTLCQHAVARYQERVRPTIELEQAEAELEAVVQNARLLETVPDWVPREAGNVALELSDGIVLVAKADAKGRLHARTVIVRGNGSETLARRRERKKRRTAKRKLRQATSQANKGRVNDPAGYVIGLGD